jgi:D-amino-acid dehydrogenase
VIGGGVVGLACALELAQRALSVCVLERDRIGSGASGGNAGWLTPSLAQPLAAPGQWRKAVRWLFDPESPFYVQPRLDPGLARWLLGFLAASRPARFERGVAALVELSRFSVDAWERLAQQPETVPFGFARVGLLAVYESAAALAAARFAARQIEPLGVPFESWSADEVGAREPAIRGRQVGGLYFPRDAQCEPYPAVRALADEARKNGVELRERTEVLDAERHGARIHALRTTAGRIRARRFVLAAGTWSGSLGRRLGVRLPMLGAKGYSIVVPPLDPQPRRSIYLAERKIAVNPHVGGLRISGTLELVGEDLSVNTRRVDAIVNGARAMLPLGEPLGETEVWRGLRPCLPDGMPVIGRAGRVRNLWLATGHQMTGLKTAPGTGRLLAELLCGERPSFDPAPFRFDRYAGWG